MATYNLSDQCGQLGSKTQVKGIMMNLKSVTNWISRPVGKRPVVVDGSYVSHKRTKTGITIETTGGKVVWSRMSPGLVDSIVKTTER